MEFNFIQVIKIWVSRHIEWMLQGYFKGLADYLNFIPYNEVFINTVAPAVPALHISKCNKGK